MISYANRGAQQKLLHVADAIAVTLFVFVATDMNEFAVVPVNATFRTTSKSANQLQIFNSINFQNLAPRKQT